MGKLIIEYSSKWIDSKDKSNTFKRYNLKRYFKGATSSYFSRLNVLIPKIKSSEEEDIKNFVESITSYTNISEIEIIYKDDFNFISKK